MWIPTYSLGMRVFTCSFPSIITAYNTASSKTLTSEATQASFSVSGLQISSTVVGTDTVSMHDIVQALSSSSDLQEGSSTPPMKRPPPSLPRPTPTPTANGDHASLDYTSRSTASARLIGGLCGGSLLVISIAILLFLRRRRLSTVAERECTTSSKRRPSLRSLSVNMDPPLQPPSPSTPKFSDINTNSARISAVYSLVRFPDAQYTPSPISLPLQMFRDAAILNNTADDKTHSPIEVIERFRQPRLRQEIPPSRDHQTEDADRNIFTDMANRPTSTAYSEPPPAYENLL